ncbi:MAG: metallophosphoesterase [Lachnospiraceae bacterium]|nr:metallophosphoesterase [Lachnospiraceae bacterium]
MKIIHCADLHLDSKMESVLTSQKARERKNEILMTFLRMVEYARKNWVSAIIIAGDFFDTENVSLKVQNLILDAIRQNPGISFLYLRGNHDCENFLYTMPDPPENLFFFAEEWTKYDFADVSICGVELTKENSSTIYESLQLESRKKNIVVLHGEVVPDTSMPGELISLKKLAGHDIDYLALGHLHTYKEGTLDERGVYVYSGCLDGRGFDECGEKGFSLIEINEGVLTHHFVPMSSRILRHQIVDVSNCENTAQMLKKVQDALISVDSSDLVKITFVGDLSLDCEKNLDLVNQYLEQNYYFGRCKDLTKTVVPVEEYRYDPTLRGEFIRQVLAAAIPEDQKASILHMGLAALAGEDFDS